MSSSSDSSGTGLIAYIIGVLIFCSFAECGACEVSDYRFNNATKNEGLQDVKNLNNYDYFECGYGDLWVSSFAAERKSTDGETVTSHSVNGTVCCGILKGCTVRWY